MLVLAGPACRQDMHDQPKYIPLRESTFFADSRSARPVVAGTVARGQSTVEKMVGDLLWPDASILRIVNSVCFVLLDVRATVLCN